MKNKIIILTLLTLSLSSCINNENEKKIEQVKTNSDEIIQETNTEINNNTNSGQLQSKTLSGAEIQTNSGELINNPKEFDSENEKDLDIVTDNKDKEILKKIVDTTNKDNINKNYESSENTDKSIDELVDGFDDELDKEILDILGTE